MKKNILFQILTLCMAMGANAQTGVGTLLSENFENGVLNPRISISKVGGFNTPPQIESNTNLGSPHCFGFGRSTCPANCYWNDVTYMYINFPAGTEVSQISFKSIELYGDFGSGGSVFINQSTPPTGSTAYIAGFHDYESSTASNTFIIPINMMVTNIVLCVADISQVSEIYIDDVLVTGQPPGPQTATATSSEVNGFTVGVTLTYGGYGYTNTPLVRLIGGGGTGAQATAVVSNGVVTGVNISNPGSGYTNGPLVVIDPPYIPKPVLNIAPMTFLSFSNLSISSSYQLQQLEQSFFWANQPISFIATNSQFTDIVAGVVSSGDYRLALTPVPAQAFATAQEVGGFVVGATVTAGGSGYVTIPAVTFVGGGGSNATAVASIASGVVTNIAITSPGIGYSSTPAVEIDPPPAVSVSPAVVLPMMMINSILLAPYDNYQIQFTPNLRTSWSNWYGGLFTPTDVTNSQILFITNSVDFFRLQYLP